MEYLVRWEINLEASSLEEAAQKALEIQRDSNSIATVMQVAESYGGYQRSRWQDVDLSFKEME